MEARTQYKVYPEPMINRGWLIQRLLEMPEEIAKAEDDLLNVAKKLETAKEELLDKEMTLYLEGKVEGKNENERKACLRNLTVAERKAVQEWEDYLAVYKMYLNRKLNEFSALKAIARLIEGRVE